MISSHINGMRAKLRAGEIVLGAGITLSDPTVTEALAPFVDFFWIDMEHNATTTEAMLGHLIAARAGGAASIVRIPSNDVGWVKRVLDSGAEGIILPRAYSAQEVADFVSACRYPPLGTRGFGPRRPMQYGRLDQQEYLQQANRDVFVVASSSRPSSSSPSWMRSSRSKGSTRSCSDRRTCPARWGGSVRRRTPK